MMNLFPSIKLLMEDTLSSVIEIIFSNAEVVIINVDADEHISEY